MTAPLGQPTDVADMWRPLADSEVDRVSSLLVKASALLRKAAPGVDARIALFEADPSAVGALDPVVAATAVATMVKKFISNVEGVVSQTAGPYAVAFALRGDKDTRGQLQVSPDILEMIAPYDDPTAVRSIRPRPGLAPSPVGVYGRPDYAAALDYSDWSQVYPSVHYVTGAPDAAQ